MDEPTPDDDLTPFTNLNALGAREREEAVKRARALAARIEGVAPQACTQMALYTIDTLVGFERAFSPRNVERSLEAREQLLRTELDYLRAEIAALELLRGDRAERVTRQDGAP